MVLVPEHFFRNPAPQQPKEEGINNISAAHGARRGIRKQQRIQSKHFAIMSHGPRAVSPTQDATTLAPEIMVQYLTGLGVTPETRRAIRDQMERKKAEEEEERKNRANGSAEGGGGTGDSNDVQAFAVRQGVDAAGVSEGDSVMVWAILEGQPAKASVFIYHEVG